MSIQQDNLNAAFPSPNDGDAVLDSTTGRYWVYSSGSGLWVEFSEGFDLPYLGTTSPIEPYSFIESYPLGIAVGLTVTDVDWDSTLSTVDLADLGVLIGGQIETVESNNVAASVTVDISTFSPTIISQLTSVDAPSTLVTTDAQTPSINVNGLRVNSATVSINANQPQIRTVVVVDDSKNINITAFEPSLLLALFFPAIEVSLTANEPEGVGSFISVGPTTITVSAFAPQRPRIALGAEFIIFYNDLIQGQVEVKTSPKVESPVQIDIDVEPVSVVTGNPIFVDQVEIDFQVYAPDVDAFPAVWEAGWWGGWTLNWNQLPETFNLNYIGSTTPEQEDVDIACAWNKPYLEDAYKTNAGVTSPNPINSINGRRAEAPTKLYPGRPEQKFSGEFTSSTEGCPRIVFTETINWGHPEKGTDNLGYPYANGQGTAQSYFASYADYSDKPWAYWSLGSINTTWDDTLVSGGPTFPINYEERLQSFRSYNFFHPGGSWHENTPSVPASRLNTAFGSSHLDVSGVFTLELWIYPLSTNFVGTTPTDYIPIMGHNQYWQYDKNHDPYNQTRSEASSPYIGDNFYTGWDLYFFGQAGTGTVGFRGSTNRYRWDYNETHFNNSDWQSVFQNDINDPTKLNPNNNVNNDPMSIFGIDTPNYTSVLYNSASGTSVAIAEEPDYYDHRVLGAANELIADQWNHIVLHCDGAGYINIATNGKWGSDQRLLCSEDTNHYWYNDGSTPGNLFVTSTYQALIPITNLRFKDYPTAAIQHHVSRMENLSQNGPGAVNYPGWTYLRETNHTDYSKITLGAFTEPFYTWMDETPQGYGAGRLATGEFTELIPGLHNRFEGYIHEIRYMPWLRYDERYYRGSYLADSYWAGELVNPGTGQAPSPTFTLPGNFGISGLTWPDFDTNLPTEPFPYSFGRREVDGTVSTVCTSIYEPELRRYYWHAFNRVRSITQHYASWTGISNEWFRHINEFIISCKKDGNWYKMSDVFVFPGYGNFRIDGFCLKGKTLQDFFTEPEVQFNTPGLQLEYRDPGYDRHYGITNSLGGDLPTANLLGLRLPRVNSEWPESDHHRATYVTKVGSGPVFSSGIDEFGSTTCDWYPGRTGIKHGFVTNQKTVSGEDAAISSGGFIGFNRKNKESYEAILPGLTGLQTYNVPSQTPWMEPVELLKTSTGQNYDYKTAVLSNHSLGFYSHGRAVDLQRLEYRVTKLMTELAALKNSWQPEQFYIGNDF